MRVRLIESDCEIARLLREVKCWVLAGPRLRLALFDHRHRSQYNGVDQSSFVVGPLRYAHMVPANRLDYKHLELTVYIAMHRDT